MQQSKKQQEQLKIPVHLNATIEKTTTLKIYSKSIW